MKTKGVPDSPEKVRQVHAAGGMLINVGFRPEGVVPDNLWPGHLAVVVPNVHGARHLLMDLTIVQAHMPQHGVELPSVCIRVSDEFVRSIDNAVGQVGDVALIYDAFPSDDSYTSTPAWTEPKDLDVSAATIVAQLRAKGM